MLYHLPKHTPPLSVMLEDLGRPHPDDIAQALGVGARTVRRWVSDDDAPRPALLSLFGVTRWGQQWAATDVHNLAMSQMALAAALQRELTALQAQVSPDVKTAPPLPMAPPMLYVVR
jgi:hypothetical protein